MANAIRKHFRSTGFVDFRADGLFDATICGDDVGQIVSQSKGFASYAAAETWLLAAAQLQIQDHVRNNRKTSGG